MSSVIKVIKIVCIMFFPGGWRKEWIKIVNGYRVSILQDGEVLDINKKYEYSSKY